MQFRHINICQTCLTESVKSSPKIEAHFCITTHLTKIKIVELWEIEIAAKFVFCIYKGED